MKLDLNNAELAIIRWALIKFAAVSEQKTAKEAMKIYDALLNRTLSGSSKRMKR